jgi:hypothetical protein
MTLYQIENGLGVYWVLAEHPTEACEKLKKLLDDADYGFPNNRKPSVITPIAESGEDAKFITGKFLVL